MKTNLLFGQMRDLSKFINVIQLLFLLSLQLYVVFKFYFSTLKSSSENGHIIVLGLCAVHENLHVVSGICTLVLVFTSFKTRR